MVEWHGKASLFLYVAVMVFKTMKNLYKSVISYILNGYFSVTLNKHFKKNK